jgi:hypothetical protein
MIFERVEDSDRLDLPLFVNDQDERKDCKKVTPCNVIKKHDIIYADGVSLVNSIKVKGYFKFDSYDKYDNTCYIVDNQSTFRINLLLADVQKVTVEKGDKAPIIRYFKYS